jgi:hypothetical protein
VAIDTRNKRASCLGMGLIALTIWPVPAGAIDQPGRQQVSGYYAGIASGILIDPAWITLTGITLTGSTLISATVTSPTLTAVSLTGPTCLDVHLHP